jgi:hypothetical protein
MEPNLKYIITPEGIPDALPISPEPLTAEEAGKELTSFLKLMESQGYWRTTNGRSLPLTDITYKIETIES